MFFFSKKLLIKLNIIYEIIVNNNKYMMIIYSCQNGQLVRFSYMVDNE